MNDDFTRRLTTAHDFVKAMNEPETIGDVGELIDEDFKIPPEVLGQIIMNHLTSPVNDEGLTVAAKQYWLAVAEHMGPDWVAEFRNVGDFMDKVTSF